MAFTVADYQDFRRLLREHPEWREELRQEILGEALLSLPDLVRQNSEDIRELRAAITELRETVAQNSADIQALKEIVRQNSADIQELKEIVRQNSAAIQELKEIVRQNSEDIRSLTEAIGRLTAESARMRDDIGRLNGGMLESWYRDRPSAISGRLRKAKVVGLGDLELVLQAEERGALTSEQVDALSLIDLIVQAREGSGATASTVLFAAEISWTVDTGDVTRVADRVETLRAAGYDARPVVVGRSIGPAATALATERGVRFVLAQHNW